MIRGSTPTHTFTLPFDPIEGADWKIVYAQGKDYEEKFLFEVTTKRITIDGRVLSLKLKQEETLLFDCEPHFYEGARKPYPVKIQIGMQSSGNDILWSDIIVTTVERCLRKDGCVRNG